MHVYDSLPLGLWDTCLAPRLGINKGLGSCLFHLHSSSNYAKSAAQIGPLAIRFHYEVE